MFIFVQPMYSKQELNADSNYVIYSQFIKAMRSVRPSWHFVVVFPDKESGYKYDDDGFFRSSNVTRVPQRISPRKMANAISFDGIWYDSLFRRIGFDVAWCNLVEIAGAIKSAGAGTFELKGRPVVVAAHNYVIHPSLPYGFEVQQHIAYAQTSGALFADWNVFNSEYCRWMLFDMAKIWLNDSALASIAEKSSLIPYGPLEPELTYAECPSDVPIIVYNHRLQAYKNYLDTFDLLAELWGEGHRFRVRYLNNTTEKIATIAKYPFVEPVFSATRADYLKALRVGHLNITNSQHETFCIAAIESMAMGQCLIAPNGITFPEITGRAENRYPYLFTSREEQKAMIIQLLSDRQEREKWGSILSAHVRSNYGMQLWASRYASLFEHLTDFKLGVAEDGRDFVLREMKAAPGQPITALYNRLAGKEINGRIPFGNQSMPPTKLVRLIRELGGFVTMEKGVQCVYPA